MRSSTWTSRVRITALSEWKSIPRSSANPSDRLPGLAAIGDDDLVSSTDAPLSPTPQRLRAGGWTGAFTLMWAVVVVLFGAALTGASWLAGRVIRSALQGVRIQVLDQSGADGLADLGGASALDTLPAIAERITAATLPWSALMFGLGLVLWMTAVQLAAGSERGRRWTRAALAGVVAATLLGAAHVSYELLGDAATWTAVLERDVASLLRLSGESFDRQALEEWISPTSVRIAIWCPAALTVVPSAVLFAATGAKSLRAWCLARNRAVASPSLPQ
jgi:hypothetical protein